MTSTSQADRVLLKLSGESLAGPERGFGIDADALRSVCSEIADAAKASARLAIVIGGGNIIRGGTLAEAGVLPRASADHMGMLGTAINAIALREGLLEAGIDATARSAAGVRGIIPEYSREDARAVLDRGAVLLLAAGVGSPYFTTDSGAALRAAELGCSAVLKATKVDGVYDKDPVKHADATRFDRLSMAEAAERRLGVVDLAAMAICEQAGVDLVVFRFDVPGNLRRAATGEPVGTRVTAQ